VEVDPAPPEGMRLTIVKLTDDQGDDIQHWDYGQQGQTTRKGMIYRYGIQDLQGGTNFNLTIAFPRAIFWNSRPKRKWHRAIRQTNRVNSTT